MLALRYILAVGIRSVFMLMGIPGNGLIIIVYCKKQRKTGTDVFILGLAIVDFVVCLSFPLKIYSYLTSQFTNDVLCKLMHFIVYWNTYLGVFLTTVITVDRYIAVCRPHKRRVSPRQAAGVILTCALLASVTAIPSVSKTGIQQYSSTSSKCSYNTDNVAYAQIIAYFNDTLFFGCLALITVLYVLIWAAVRRQARVRVVKLGGAKTEQSGGSLIPCTSDAGTRTRNPTNIPVMKNGHTIETSCQSTNGVINTPLRWLSGGNHTSDDLPSSQPKSTSDRSSNPLNQLVPPPLPSVSGGVSQAPVAKPAAPATTIRPKNKTTITIFIITVIFFLSWIPTKIWDYYPNVKFTWIQTDPVRYNIFFTSLFAVNLNQVINPFIYSFVSVQFRKECINVMRQIRQCRFLD